MTTETLEAGNWRKPALFLPVVLAAIIYLFSTTNRGITDYDEAYYVQPALHMVESGNWVTPYVNGVRFLEKPPLLYWITATSFKLFGINEFALRLPTALAVIALVWIVVLSARRAAGERAGFAAGLSAAFCVGSYLFTRETLHDVWLVLFLSLAMYAFIKWYLDPAHSRAPALLFYAALAGAILCKSLIGIAFPIGILCLFFLLSREWPEWRKLHILPGSLLFLALTVPWHWLAEIQNQGFLKFFFVSEQVLRFFGKREPPVLWEVPLLTFWALVLVWFFPWTAFLPAAFIEGWNSKDRKLRMLTRLALSWAIVIIGFFSLSDRLEHYVFPALPALSLLAAVALGANGSGKSTLWGFRGLAILGIVVALASAGAGIWLAAGPGFHFAGTGPTNRLAETDYSILAEMPASILAELIKPAVCSVIALAVGFLIALRFELKQRRRLAVGCIAGAMMVICIMAHWSLAICEDLISSKKFGMAVAKECRPGDRLVVVGDYEAANSLNFYEPLSVEIYGGTAYALIPGMKYPDSPKIILSEPEFKNAWQSARRVFVLAPKERVGELNPKGIEMLTLLHRVLVRNH